jgi:hypothetical protein
MSERPEFIVIVIGEDEDKVLARSFSAHWTLEDAEKAANRLNQCLGPNRHAGIITVPTVDGIIEGSDVQKP